MPVAPSPTVVLRHDRPDGGGHFDWMLAVEPEGKLPLITFRLEDRVDELSPEQSLHAERIRDHRPVYLEKEGPLDGDRGEVTRLRRGVVQSWGVQGDRWTLNVHWEAAGSDREATVQKLELTDDGDHGWFIACLSVKRSEQPAASAPERGTEDDMAKASSDDSTGAGARPHHYGSTSFPQDPSNVPDAPVPMAEPEGPAGMAKKITAFEREGRHDEQWKRRPNTTGRGAIHVRTFHTKLTDEALKYMDETINEWLDAHPEYEVKFVSSTVGTVTGKLKEPHLICQVWV